MSRLDRLIEAAVIDCYYESEAVTVDAAWEVLDATVQPFVEDLKRHGELGLEAEALEICKGALLGL